MKAYCAHCLFCIDSDGSGPEQCPACYRNPATWIHGDPPNPNPEVTTLYQIGSEVLLGDEIRATVIGIEIKHEFRIRYNVAWWDNRNYRDLWLYDFEIKATSKSKTMTATFAEN